MISVRIYTHVYSKHACAASKCEISSAHFLLCVPNSCWSDSYRFSALYTFMLFLLLSKAITNCSYKKIQIDPALSQKAQHISMEDTADRFTLKTNGKSLADCIKILSKGSEISLKIKIGILLKHCDILYYFFTFFLLLCLQQVLD